MCLYPTLIINKKYTSNKKNGGYVPPITDPRTQYVPIGYGDCMECRKKKAREWQIRLQEEIKTNKNGKFVTLTFSNESILKLTQESHESNIKSTAKRKPIDLTKLSGYQYDNALATLALRYFLERWRKKYKKSLRHWLVTELGHNGTENIHLHGIIWTDEDLNTVEKIWEYGWMWKGKKRHQTQNDKQGTLINYVSAKTVNYIIKYITKQDDIHRTYKSIILTSAGIGNMYIHTYNAKQNRYKQGNTRQTYKTNTGHEVSLPIYWRNKIYNEQEREKLWLEQLDKNERYVGGEKVDISKGEENYYAALKYYQKLNEKLGYGNGEKTWEQVKYEEERRNLMNEQRKIEAQRKQIIKGNIHKIIIYDAPAHARQPQEG